MADRYDLVLAAIPLVAASGMLLERLVAVLAPAVDAAGSIAALPLALCGFAATFALIAHEVVTFPVGE